jgi:hypothetical protein
MSESDSTSPSLPQSPSLLQSLRQRSAAVHDAHSAPRPHAPDRRAIDRSLLAAFRWLDEALGHLAVIRPVVAHRFALTGLLTIATPRYDRGFASYRRTSIGGFELIERIELYYRMANDEPIRLEVQPAAAFATEERLRSAQLDYRYMIEHDEVRTRRGVFLVTPAVMAAVRFAADYDRGIVAVTLRNVDRFESVTLAFAPDDIGEPSLEDLVRLMMGEANAFLRRAPLAGIGRAPAAACRPAASLSPSRYGAGAG